MCLSDVLELVCICVCVQTLAGLSDVENFSEMVDTLEEQGIENCMFVSQSKGTWACAYVI